jgi:hypothetical protein
VKKRIRLPVVYEPNSGAISIDPAGYSPKDGNEDLVCGGCGNVLFASTSLGRLRASWEQPRAAASATCAGCHKPLHIPDVPQPHPSFPEPADKNIKVWRYMDLTKFLSLLQRGGLFFPKAPLLGDPFEGSTPRMNRALWESVIPLRKLQPNAPFIEPFKEMSDEAVSNMVRQFTESRRTLLDKYLVNSWHMNEHESAAMWKLYTAANESICIQTTYSKLRSNLPAWVFVGMVNYIDYDSMTVAEGNVFNFVMVKRHSFDYEREVRAVTMSMMWEVANTDIRDKLTSEGIWIDTDLASLLDAIYISPRSPAWFADSVSRLVEKYDLTVPVRQSSLSASPVY